MKRLIETEEEEDDFLSAVAAAEESLTKRRKPSSDEIDIEGAYTAALKGTKSHLWQNIDPLQTKTRFAASAAPGSREPDPDKPCPCGSGPCLILTANTEKNRGRMFYKCPLRQENGGCGFFMWCDNDTSSQTNSISMPAKSYSIPKDAPSATLGTRGSDYSDKSCPCGSGPCLILTANTEKNRGRMFYKCPLRQENGSCGFFMWCDTDTAPQTNSFPLPTKGSSGGSFKSFNDHNASTDPLVSASKSYCNMNDPSNNTYIVRTGSSCFKCGNDGHWAKDCNVSSSDAPAEFGEKTSKSGTCYKCSKPGHWARDCTSMNAGKNSNSNVYFGSGPKNV